MKEKVEYNIHKFSNSVDSDILEQIYFLNQKNTPEVGSLSSIKDLQNLIRLSSINYYVISQDKIIGFIICFREHSTYDSENYKFFSKEERNFLYVDRIAISHKYRRFGIGKNLYLKIEQMAVSNNLPICCEVNTDPLNEISIKFHKDFGFFEIGNRKFKDHSVAYFKKLCEY